MEKILTSPWIWDRSKTLVNLSSSILKHFGVTPFHQSIDEIDTLLDGRKKVALFLFDGMGEYNLHVHGVAGKTFLDHRYMTIYSTNPPTTVAATTALLTGKYPIETGWLGWSLHIDELGIPVDVFPSQSSIDGSNVENGIMFRLCPIKTIDELMIEKGVKAHMFFQDGVGGRFGGPKTMDDAPAMVGDFFQNQGGQFAYIYFNNPDGVIHHHGVASKEVDDMIVSAARCVDKFTKENPDVLTMVIADHGLIDVEYVDIGPFADLNDCLKEIPSIEGRLASFFLKEGKEEQFLAAMKKHLPSFALFKKEEIMKNGFFGEGIPCQKAYDFIGDYIGISTDKTIIHDTVHKSNTYHLHAHHAGPSKEEKEILLAAYNAK